MHNLPLCLHCGSENVTNFRNHADLFECLDCGEFFEDEDEFILEEIKRHRTRKQEKNLRDS